MGAGAWRQVRDRPICLAVQPLQQWRIHYTDTAYPWAAAAFAGLGGIGGLLCWHTCRARLSRKLDRQGLLAISHLQHGLYGPAVSDVLAS